MTELIEAIRAAVAEHATAEQKATGAQACRTILAALGAEPGKPIALPGAPPPHPLAGLTADQALALVISRLTSIAEAKEAQTTEAQVQEAATADPPVLARPHAAPRIAFVNPPPPPMKRPTGTVPAAPAATRRRAR